MKTKIKALLCVVMALCLCATILTACKSDSNSTHEHTLFDFEAKPVTCLEDGIKAHKYCLYCQKTFINGKEVKAEELVIKSNPDVHNLVSHDLEQSTCATAGLLAHDQCVDCHRIFIDGKEVTAEQLILPYGDHSWNGSLECANCNAYKLLYNGDYTVIENANVQQFVSHPMGATHTTAARPNYIEAWWSNRMTMSTQNGSGSTVTNVDGNIWRIEHTKGVGSFTRLAYGEGDQAYIGKVLLTFDVTVSTDAEIERLGVKVVDGIKADPYANGIYSKLLGTRADEENNPNRKFIPGTVYRFVYMLELTEEEQLIQFFTANEATSGEITFEISNMHFVNLDEELTGVPTALLVSFGTADDEPLAKEECAHEFAYDVEEVEPNCIHEGNIAYNHCPQCGLNTVDGIPQDNVKVGKIDHEYGELIPAEESTCTEQGHDAYYQCSVCDKYFAENHTELEGIPMRSLKEHDLGSWENNADGHWKTCSECKQKFETAEHTPGPEATDDTPQICTECEFIITPALAHHHEFNYTPEKPATCEEDGNVAYYYCDGCKKYYEDNEGNQEIKDIVLEKLGHKFGSLVNEKAPTCTEDGNDAYYYCPQCSKYYDESQQNDITATYLKAKLNHAGMESHDVTSATCYQRGSERSYYYCPICAKYFENENGSGELAPEDIFTLPFEAHDFSQGDTCANAGCNMTRVKDSVESSITTGNVKNDIYKAANENPGKWAAQSTSSSNKATSGASFSDGVLSGWITNGTKANANKLFVRINPSQDGSTKFIGTFLWVLEFKVTEALGNNTNAANLAISFCIKNSNVDGAGYDTTIGGWDGSGDSDYFDYEVGKTYRFAVIMEITGDYQVGQINIRNGANSGANFEISNSYFAFYSASVNTGSNLVEKADGYGQEISSLSTASYDMPIAILPSTKYDYVG